MKIVKKSLNESVENFVEGYSGNLRTDIFNSLADVMFNHYIKQGAEPSKEELRDAVEYFFKQYYSKWAAPDDEEFAESCESCKSPIKDDEVITEEKGDKVYYIGYTTEGGDDKVFKKLKDLSKLRDLTKDLLSNTDKLDSLNAIALYVNEKDTEEEIFVTLKDEDTGEWDVVLDEFERGIYNDLDDDYKNIPLNQVFYSLTGLFPDNFRVKAPELYDSVIKTGKGTYLDLSECGVDWDGDDAIININIDRIDDKMFKKVNDWVKEVANHFNLEPKQTREGSYKIRIKDQAKLLTDVKEK